MSIKLDPIGDDFLLSRKGDDGVVSTIRLSPMDVVALSQSSHSLVSNILKRLDPKAESHKAVVATELAQVALHDESLGQAILMTLIGKDGSRVTYAAPLQIAELLVDRLPVFLSRLKAAKPTKQ